MTIVKRLLLPFLLFGFALLPSSISAARQGTGHASDLQASDLRVAVPTQGDPHGHRPHGHEALGHPYHAHAGDPVELDLDDNADSQESEQNNHADQSSCGLISIGDVAPINAQITTLPINNLQVLGGVSDVEEQSTMRDNDQKSGNDEINQSNQSDQDQQAGQGRAQSSEGDSRERSSGGTEGSTGGSTEDSVGVS